ncbi:hypothetical protein [Rufibacter immobilis]|uniref:hypothetical protein n=1 Tax=Rufibacter immobilis TaxID=1348778 RepID=UPI0035E64A03
MELNLPAEELPPLSTVSTDYTPEQQEIIEEYHHVQPVWKFALLSFFTFGLYELYWFYKNWSFIKEFEERDEIMPFWRGLFILFFGQSLFRNVLKRAHQQGYSQSYSSGWLLAAFIFLTFLSRLPDPLWLISLFSFIPLIPVLQARNYFFSKTNPEGKVSSAFTGGEIVTMVIGLVVFVLMIIGLSIGDQPY